MTFCKDSVGEIVAAEGKRTPGRSRRGWKGDIEIYLRERGWVGTGWIDLTLDK